MPRVSDSYREDRRNQILRAAERCFAAAGFHGTSMDDICRGSGLSPGAVYRYFDGKDAIVQALSERYLASDLASILSVTAAAETAFDALSRLVDHFFDPEAWDKEDAGGTALSLEIWSEGTRNGCIGPALTETFAAIRTAFAGIIRRGQAEGEFDASVDPETIASALMSVHPGYRLQRALQLAPAAKTYATAVKALLRGLRPRET